MMISRWELARRNLFDEAQFQRRDPRRMIGRRRGSTTYGLRRCPVGRLRRQRPEQPRSHVHQRRTLLGGQAVPPDGFRVVLRHARTGAVPDPEVELRVSVALRRGFAPPGGSFGVILLDTTAGGVYLPEAGLRIRIARLGAGAQVGKFLCC